MVGEVKSFVLAIDRIGCHFVATCLIFFRKGLLQLIILVKCCPRKQMMSTQSRVFITNNDRIFYVQVYIVFMLAIGDMTNQSEQPYLERAHALPNCFNLSKVSSICHSLFTSKPFFSSFTKDNRRAGLLLLYITARVLIVYIHKLVFF